MIAYFFLLAPCFFAALLFRRHLGLYAACVLYVALISGMRFEVGYDYPAYVDMFNQAVEYSAEPLSEVLLQVSRALGASQYFFLLSSALIVGAISIALWRMTPLPMLGLWVFVCMPYQFLVSFSIVRQYIAIAIVFFAFGYLSRKRVLLRLILVGMAGGFHVSALMVLPIVVLWPHMDRRIRPIILLASIPLMFLLCKLARGIVVSYVPFSEVYFGEGDNGLKLYMMYLAIFLVFLKFRNVLLKTEDMRRYFNMFYLGIALFSLTIGFSEAASRISYYFLIFSIPLIVAFVRLFSPPMLARGIVVFGLSLLCYLQLYIASNNPAGDPYSPYTINHHFLSNAF